MKQGRARETSSIRKRMWRHWLAWPVLLFTAVVISACGADEAPSPTAAPTNPPVTQPTAEPAQVERTPIATVEPDLLSLLPSTGAYAWEVTVVDEAGSKPTLALAPDGMPHIAYMLEDMVGFVKHAIADSDGWKVSTVDTGYFYGPLDVRVDQDGVPHLSWHNHDVENLAYGTLSDGGWAVFDINHAGHDGWDGTIAIDSDGHPHMASIDPSQFGSSSGVEYAVFDGESWTIEEIGSGPVPYEFGTAIGVDGDDRPHVAWFDDEGKDLKYAVKEDGSCNISTIDSEGDVGRFPSLVVDESGNVAVAYYEQTGRTSGLIKFARSEGTGWDIQVVDELESVFMGHFGARRNSSLVLDPDGNPIVAYSDEQTLKLASWDGSEWRIETVHTAAATPLGQQVSLARDQSGTLHLTFADVSHKAVPGVKGAILYAKGVPQESATSAR